MRKSEINKIVKDVLDNEQSANNEAWRDRVANRIAQHIIVQAGVRLTAPQIDALLSACGSYYENWAGDEHPPAYFATKLRTLANAERALRDARRD